LIFGGLLGFWGVFFAIPLASVIKAILSAVSNKKPTSAKQLKF
jgi:putative permease